MDGALPWAPYFTFARLGKTIDLFESIYRYIDRQTIVKKPQLASADMSEGGLTSTGNQGIVIA